MTDVQLRNEMKTKKIAEQFDLVSSEYDLQRKKFIPCFDDYYITTTDFIAKSIPKPDKILDLGAGTGLLSKYFYEHFESAEYTLVDVSDKMLEIAKKRFDGLNNFKFQILDYSEILPDEKYDLIVSALSIHHLGNNEKSDLFQNIYNALPEHGVFVNYDQFNASSDKMNELYNKYWYDYIKNSDLPIIEHERWLKRRELDKENTIEETIYMLKKSGFQMAECIYSYMKFGVVMAMK